MGSDPVTVPPPPTLPLEEMTAALSEEEARAILPDLARKIKAGKVTFDDIVECHYEAEPITPLAPPQAGGSADPAVSKRRRAFAALLEPATDAFHAAHPIESMFFCEKVESAAALVRSPRMKAGSLPGWFPAPRGDDWEIRYSLDWTAEDKEILPYLNRCASLAIQSDRLPRVESITAKRVIFEAYCSALDALDK